jgi:hypothetical protein
MKRHLDGTLDDHTNRSDCSLCRIKIFTNPDNVDRECRYDTDGCTWGVKHYNHKRAADEDQKLSEIHYMTYCCDGKDFCNLATRPHGGSLLSTGMLCLAAAAGLTKLMSAAITM